MPLDFKEMSVRMLADADFVGRLHSSRRPFEGVVMSSIGGLCCALWGIRIQIGNI